MNSKPRRFSKLSLLMAAYNEEATLRRCAERVLAVPLPEGLVREIVLVDDGSTDATWEIAQRLAARHPEIRIFNQPRNMGKGAAVRRAAHNKRSQAAGRFFGRDVFDESNERTAQPGYGIGLTRCCWAGD